MHRRLILSRGEVKLTNETVGSKINRLATALGLSEKSYGRDCVMCCLPRNIVGMLR